MIAVLDVATIMVVSSMFGFIMYLGKELTKTERRLDRLARELDELTGELRDLKHATGSRNVVQSMPPEPAKKQKPSPKQIDTAVSELRRISGDLG